MSDFMIYSEKPKANGKGSFFFYTKGCGCLIWFLLAIAILAFVVYVK